MHSDQVRKPILRVLVGSRAHNLHTEDSDYDYRGVFVVPTTDLLSLGKSTKTTNWVEGRVDDTSWEVGHFLFLSTKCNPNILDVFRGQRVPIEDHMSVIGGGEEGIQGSRLLSLWPHVLCRRHVLNAFLGYSHNQAKKLMDQEAVDTPRTWKFGVTYLRALLNGRELLATGTYTMATAGDNQAFLTEVREGKVSRGRIIDRAVELQADMHKAYAHSPVPEEPNLEAVNEFLLDLRKAYWTFS